MRHPLHSICPYFAMFPESFVTKQLLAYTERGDIVFDPFSGFSIFDSTFLTVTEPLGCHVSTPRELMIKSTSVVDDSLRTVFNPGSSDARNGV